VLLLFLLSFVTGLIVKYTDVLEDNNITKIKYLNILLGIFYGILLFIIPYLFPEVTVLIIATVLGLVLSGKFDAPGHYIGIVVLFSLFAMFGLSPVNMFYFITILFTNIIEEYINDEFVDKNKIKNKVLQKILSLRPVLEITVFLISVYSGVWSLWISLLGFDIGYQSITIYEKQKNKKKELFP